MFHTKRNKVSPARFNIQIELQFSNDLENYGYFKDEIQKINLAKLIQQTTVEEFQKKINDICRCLQYKKGGSYLHKINGFFLIYNAGIVNSDDNLKTNIGFILDESSKINSQKNGNPVISIHPKYKIEESTELENFACELDAISGTLREIAESINQSHKVKEPYEVIGEQFDKYKKILDRYPNVLNKSYSYMKNIILENKKSKSLPPSKIYPRLQTPSNRIAKTKIEVNKKSCCNMM